MDSKLSWKDHVAQTSRLVHSFMYRQYFFRKSTNLSLHKHLILMLLFPIIDYCCLAYCDLTLDLDDKLQKLVNTGIRYIYGMRKSKHITPYRLELYTPSRYHFSLSLSLSVSPPSLTLSPSFSPSLSPPSLSLSISV